MNIRKVKSLVVKGLDKLNDRRYGNAYASWMKSLGIPNAPVSGEREWAEK